jgi:hypothetical protein
MISKISSWLLLKEKFKYRDYYLVLFFGLIFHFLNDNISSLKWTKMPSSREGFRLSPRLISYFSPWSLISSSLSLKIHADSCDSGSRRGKNIYNNSNRS